MPTTRYAVVKYIQDWEYPHYQIIKIFATKEAAEKYSNNLSAKALHEKFEKGKVPYYEWDYEWNDKSEKLFFQYLKTKEIFPKSDFNANDIIEVKNVIIKMLEKEELESFRFQREKENVNEWLKIEDYFVQTLKHF